MSEFYRKRSQFKYYKKLRDILIVIVCFIAFITLISFAFGFYDITLSTVLVFWSGLLLIINSIQSRFRAELHYTISELYYYYMQKLNNTDNVYEKFNIKMIIDELLEAKKL